MKELSLKGRVFPTDLNHHGNVFGGWLMGKMDKACSIAVQNIIRGDAVTVSVSEILFKKPVHNGDIFNIYTQIMSIGRSSICIQVFVNIVNNVTNEEEQVTTAEFKFVAVENGQSIPVKNVLRYNVAPYVKELMKKKN